LERPAMVAVAPQAESPACHLKGVTNYGPGHREDYFEGDLRGCTGPRLLTLDNGDRGGQRFGSSEALVRLTLQYRPVLRAQWPPPRHRRVRRLTETRDATVVPYRRYERG
jgi:hypothetical protein